jgi:hypothetical protein
MKDFLDNYTEGESTEAHQKDLLLAEKGWFKFSPEIGVGLTNILNDESSHDLVLEIRKEFNKDGMQIDFVRLRNGKLEIEAIYKSH